MAVWAIADLHLSLGTPNKEMDVFGAQWANHTERIATHWRAKIKDDDLVLLAGDISWALSLEQVAPDLAWIDALPGTKVMLRGNHDYWWSSLKKLAKIMPPSIHIIQNNAFSWRDYCIGGTRLWDTSEYGFNRYTRQVENLVKPKLPFALEEEVDLSQRDKIFERELTRLELSLKAMPPTNAKRIVMVHYPPIGVQLRDSRVSAILEYYKVQVCVFGHVHNMLHDFDPLFGIKNGVHYRLVAADYLDFDPLLIYD